MKKFLIKSTLLLLMVSVYSFAFSQKVEIFTLVDSINPSSSIDASCSDRVGNRYVSGNGYDAVKLGNKTLAFPRRYVGKIGPNNETKWIVKANNSSESIFGKVHCDNFGKVTVSSATFDFNNRTKISSSIISQIDSSGQLLWSEFLLEQLVCDFKSDNNGNLYVAGTINNVHIASFTSFPFFNRNIPVPHGYRVVYFAGIDPKGKVKWLKIIYEKPILNYVPNPRDISLAVDDSANVHVAFRLDDNVTVDQKVTPLPSNRSQSAFLLSFDSSGTMRYGISNPRGYFTYALTYQNQRLHLITTSNGRDDNFTTTYDLNGNELYVKSAPLNFGGVVANGKDQLLFYGYAYVYVYNNDMSNWSVGIIDNIDPIDSKSEYDIYTATKDNEGYIHAYGRFTKGTISVRYNEKAFSLVNSTPFLQFFYLRVKDTSYNLVTKVNLDYENKEASSPFISPSPAYDKTKFFLYDQPNQNKSKLLIFDNKGCKVKELHITEKETEIEVNYLPEGLYYYLYLSDANQSFNKGKFLIKK